MPLTVTWCDVLPEECTAAAAAAAATESPPNREKRILKKQGTWKYLQGVTRRAMNAVDGGCSNNNSRCFDCCSHARLQYAVDVAGVADVSQASGYMIS